MRLRCKSSILHFLLGVLGFIVIILLDQFYLQRGLLAEGWPRSSLAYFFRSLLIFLSTLGLLLGVAGDSRPKLILDLEPGLTFKKLSVLVSYVASLIVLLLFLFRIDWFNDLTYEDGLIEWGSALLLFLSCFVTAVVLIKSMRMAWMSIEARLSIALISFGFFVIGMEEVSWFQRVLDIDTPKAFSENGQNEINFHNFFTDPSENIYYFGAFVLLVLLPFVRLMNPGMSRRCQDIAVPGVFVVLVGAIPCAYNFAMWNIVFLQVAFYSSIIILTLFARLSARRGERGFIVAALFFLMTTQIMFLFGGERYVRGWEVTEFKEFFIPLAFFVYSIDLYQRVNKRQALFRRSQFVGRDC